MPFDHHPEAAKAFCECQLKKRPAAVRSWGPKKNQNDSPELSNPIKTPKQEEIDVKPSPVDSEARQRVLKALETFTSWKSKNVNAWTACKKMREEELWLDRDTHYIGHTPGVQVGDVFHYRGELLVVNLHRSTRGGINYIKASINPWNKTIANSIVVSEGYYPNEVHDNCFIYTGSGVKTEDQRMVRGNLALANSSSLQILIRVIRVMRKVFRYEGLYKVKRVWDEKNSAGFLEYKYLMEPWTGYSETMAFKDIISLTRKRKRV